MVPETEKRRFLLLNLIKGFLWFAGIIGLMAFVQISLNIDYQVLIDQLADRIGLVLLVFILSEVVFGIIPPEIFMLWAAGSSGNISYPVMMGILGALSYGAGVSGYFIGRALSHTRFYLWLHKNVLQKQTHNLRRYGFFLLIVAALTPIPYSAICMLMGAIGYPKGQFLIFAAFRFLRFTIFAWIMLEISNLWFLV